MDRQRLFNLTLKVFLFLSPIFFFRIYNVNLARGMFFLFGSFTLFGISLANEPKRKLSNPWLALILLAGLLRVFVNNDFGNFASEWLNFWFSSAGFIYLFAGILLFHTVYCHTENIKQYLTPILAVCILNFVLVIAQITGHDFMWAKAPSLSGFMSISSQLGQYSALSIPLVFLINPYLAIIPLTTLFMAKSVSAILALCIGLIFYSTIDWKAHTTRWQRQAIWAFLTATLLLGIYNYQYILSRWQCRPVMWEKTARVVLQRPYLGHGYQSFNETVVHSVKSFMIGDREFSRAHNDLLHTAQELGIPIALFIVGLFIGLWKKFKVAKKDASTYLLATSVLIVLINMCGQTLIRYAEIAGTFIVVLALLCIKLEEQNAESV